MNRFVFTLCKYLLTLLGLVVFSGHAQSQAYPSKPSENNRPISSRRAY
jgi:hypothetical protein